jgi:hypothetical protein
MMGLARRSELARCIPIDCLQHCDTSEYHRAIVLSRISDAMRGNLRLMSIMFRWRDRPDEPGNSVPPSDELFAIRQLDRLAEVASRPPMSSVVR